MVKIHVPNLNGKCVGCEDKLELAHPYLSFWFNKYVQPNYPNAHVAWSYRSEADQDEMVKDGKSRLKFPKSAHNRRVAINPALPFDVLNEKDANTKPEAAALDLFEIDDDNIAQWNPAFFKKLADDIVYYGLKLKWGGIWQTLGDKDHYQMTFWQG